MDGKQHYEVLEALVENTKTHLAFLDREFNFVAVNAAYAEGSGYKKEELLGRNHFELFPNAENEEIFRLARDLGKVVEYKEKPFVYQDQPARGITYWNWRLTTIKNEAGSTSGLVFSLTDVTESTRAKHLSDLLHKLNNSINAELEFDSVAGDVLLRVTRALECEYAVLALRDTVGWVFKYTHGFSRDLAGLQLSEEVSPFALCSQSKGVVAIKDIEHDSLAACPIIREFGIKAILSAPLMLKDRVIGGLAFGYRVPKDFSPCQKDFAANLGTSITLALENSRLYEEKSMLAQDLQRSNERLEQAVQRRTDQLKKTNQLLRLFATEISRKDYLQSVVKLVRKWSGCAMVGVRVLNEEGELPFEAYTGFSDEFCRQENCLMLGVDECACTRVVLGNPEEQDRPFVTRAGSFICNNTQKFIAGLKKEQGWFRGTFIKNGFQTLALIPIRYRDTVLGAVHIADKNKNMVSSVFVQFMEEMMPMVGEALHRFNLEEENRRNLDIQLVINTLLSLPLDKLSIEEILEKGALVIKSVSWIAPAQWEKVKAFAYRDGERNDYPWNGKHIKALTDTLVGIVQRKRAEEELRLSEERFFKSFNASPNPMAIVTLEDGQYIDVNEQFAEYVGYTRQEIIGKTRVNLDFWTNNDGHCKMVTALNRTGAVRNMEIKFQKKSGEICTGLLTAEVMEVDGQECMLTIINDITERKRLEKEMARLDRLNLVGEMAAGIGHEIRNPMTAARGFLQLLMAKDECKKYVEYFELIIDELDRANFIITEFLSMAKNRSVVLRERNLNSVVEAIYSLINADATLTNKSLCTQLGVIPNVMVEEREIRQLILNLARNGLEAMSPKGTLTIETFMENNRVVLAVKDEGPGIPEELIDKVGTPFFTTKDKGTGLGLAICYSIADRHGATIEIDSSPQGTTFYVKFGEPKSLSLASPHDKPLLPVAALA